jgi:hypothetical protein
MVDYDLPHFWHYFMINDDSNSSNINLLSHS